jgi:hypothetical protein
MPAVVALAGFVALLLAAMDGGQTTSASLRTILARADAYLASYQQQLTYLLADERYVQRILAPADAQPRTRDLSGELFVTFVPADRKWIAVHDFVEMDGRPVPDREDLRKLLGRNAAGGAARELINRNARFNIGTVIRNFNEPTLGLLVLEAGRRSQFRFERVSVTREDGVELATIGFRETKGPTLVRGVNGGDVRSTGEMAIEMETGRVRRTRMQLSLGPVHAELVTTYGPAPNLGLWVPVAFSERYERMGNPRELMVCDATYTNWRRFDVDVKIK